MGKHKLTRDPGDVRRMLAKILADRGFDVAMVDGTDHVRQNRDDSVTLWLRLQNGFRLRVTV